MFKKNQTKFAIRSLLLSVLTLIGTALPASAEMGYRYWGYFQAAAGATTWTAAMTGPSVEVKDGDVEGWTFTASSNDIPATAPMMDPDFAGLCSEVSEVAGKVRVGLVVDFGSGEIAPDGDTPNEFFSDCIIVPEGSVGLDVLQAALEIRTNESGLICGIAGYPSEECGAEIDMAILQTATGATAEPIAAEDESSGGSTNFIPLALLALVAALVGWFALRRRSRGN